jgi:hypothetical protein
MPAMVEKKRGGGYTATVWRKKGRKGAMVKK